MARVVAVSSAKNQARSGKHLPAAASSCVDPQTAQRTHVSSTHTRTFAGTHLKTRRIVRLCIITLCTAASRRISAHPRPPTRPIGRPLQPFFEISFQTVWTMVGFSTGFSREFYRSFVLSLFIFKVHRLLRARTLNPLTDPKARPAQALVCPVWVTMIIGPLSTQPRPPTVQF